MPEHARIRWALATIFLAAAALRLAMVPRAGIYHPDELFQYLEQAHRLLFGVGVVPWEYRYGMRSWLLPLLVAGPMAAGQAVAPGTALYLLAPRAAAALLSLSVVWTAWAFGARRSPTVGLIAAAIAAIWAEFVYTAPHILSENLSLALVLPAAALATGRAGLRSRFAAGLLLGIGFILRVQHGPAIATVVALALLESPRPWRPLVAGGAAALAIGACVDLAMGQWPFGWAVEYVRQNVILHRADRYGVASPLAYPQAFAVVFGWWVWPMLALAAVGARVQPLLLRVGVLNLAVHMALGHKEYRFVLLTGACFLLLAALGSGVAVASAMRRWPRGRILFPAAMLIQWTCASAAIAQSGRPAEYAALDRRGLALFEALRSDGDVCGVASHGLHFTAGGGYTYLHRDVPLYTYAPWQGAAMRAERAGYNRLVAPAFVRPPPGFRRSTCQRGVADEPAACLFTRQGGCTAVAGYHEINATLVRIDE